MPAHHRFSIIETQVEEEKTGVADRNHGAIEITSAPNYSLTFDVGHTWSVNEKSEYWVSP
jgi:hypothetical protein